MVFAAVLSDRQHRADSTRQLTAPEGKAVSRCPDQPPSTLILLAGPAPPDVSSASAAANTHLSFNSQDPTALLARGALHCSKARQGKNMKDTPTASSGRTVSEHPIGFPAECVPIRQLGRCKLAV